jgi:hypothetical protein
MSSPITGVWELVSDTDKAMWIFTASHFSYVSNRQEGRGHAGTYRTEGHHLHLTRFVSAPRTAVTQVTMEFQRDGERLTTRLLTEGNAVPVGHMDTFRRIAP